MIVSITRCPHTVNGTIATRHSDLILLDRNPDECIVGAFHDDGSCCVWNIRGAVPKHIRTIELHSYHAHVRTAAGHLLVTSSDDGTSIVSNWKTGHILWTHKFGEKYGRIRGKDGALEDVGCCVFAHAVFDGKVVLGTTDGKLWIFGLETGFVFPSRLRLHPYS